jgi:NAD(P) transhydrogenase
VARRASGQPFKRATVQAAKLGKRVAIVELEVEVGGICVHKGTIPSKTFREAVLSLNNEITTIKDTLVDKNRRSSDRRRQPTAEKLFSRVDDNVLSESRVQREQLKRNGVDVIPGMASFDDLHSVRITSSAGDRIVTADKILIASGTKPNQPENISPDLSCVITSDDILELGDLPRNLVVIGCGSLLLSMRPCLPILVSRSQSLMAAVSHLNFSTMRSSMNWFTKWRDGALRFCWASPSITLNPVIEPRHQRYRPKLRFNRASVLSLIWY